MSLDDTAAYDRDNVVFDTYEEIAEATEYQTDDETISVTALWGSVQVIDSGYGVPAGTRTVWIRTSELAYAWGARIVPRANHSVIRYPTGYGDGTRETWIIIPGGVTRERDLWVLQVQKGQA